MRGEIQKMVFDLKQHMAVCHELLNVVERESQCLKTPGAPALREVYQRKQVLFPELTESLEGLKRHRMQWQRLSVEEKKEHPEFSALVRQCQELVMKIITLDRENEQGLLRQGLVPPEKVPSANRQRPHFVAQLYRQNGNS